VAYPSKVSYSISKQIYSIDLGIIPLFSAELTSPNIVHVFPDPVGPYVNTHTFSPVVAARRKKFKS